MTRAVGDGGATVGEVAARAGVSVATVSRALRGLPNVAAATRERVLVAAAELRYRPNPNASRLATGRSHAVGVVVPVLGRWYFGQLVAAVAAALATSGIDLIVYTAASPEDRSRLLGDALPLRKRVDGVVLVDVPLQDPDVTRWNSSGVHLVTVGQRTPAFPSVTIDERGAAAAVVRHLVSLGHRRIGLVGGQPSDTGFHFSVPDLRRDGYREALAEAGLRPDARLEFDGDFTIPGGQAATDRLLEGASGPTAVFALSDEMALGVLASARTHGLSVPGDLSVAGFDGSELAAAVDLTTLGQPVASIGADAARLLLEDITGPRSAPTHVVAPTTLVLRGTTGPASEP